MDHGSVSSVASTSAHRPNVATLEPKHKVFLSHSGAQKGFVEQLWLDLERSDRYAFFDKCRDSLPVGKNFPQLIFEAIEECEVGVVVLSEEYFSRSKWPMVELSALVKAQRENANVTILPVFLGISRKQCRDAMQIQEWVSKWRGWGEGDSRVDVEEWEQALRGLGPINDLCCVDGTLGEVECREEIVKAVCNLVPPNSRMDDSHVEGKSRLCKVIREKIEEVMESGWYGVRVVGVYGVGGIGKTTACRTLCNEYHREFRGKVCHAELGNENESALLQDMLKRLTDTRHEVVRGFNAEECRDRLKRDIHKQRVLLAVDNVSDSLRTIEQAISYLRVGYCEGSIIIVTARSLDVLCALKLRECDCLEMPELEEVEARSLFLQHANLATNESMEKMIVEHVERCRFKKGNGSRYHYHPLALNVMGLQVGLGLGKWMEGDELDAFNKLRDGDEHPVFSILRKSFDSLLEEDKLLFMDAALFVPAYDEVGLKCRGDWVFQWLSMVHGISVDVLKKRLLGLKRKSLIEKVGDGSTRMSIHDLWREFAVMETRRGEERHRAWVYKMYDPDEMRAGDIFCVWGGGKDVRRICLQGKDDKFYEMKEVNLENCSNVTVLKLLGLKLADMKLDLSRLKHLKSLELGFESISGRGVEILGLRQLTNLVEIVWRSLKMNSSAVEDIGWLTNLQVLRLEYIRMSDKLLNLGRLTSLREVSLNWTDVDTISGLNSRMTNLQYLDLTGNRNLRACHGVSELVALKFVCFWNCEKLQKLPNLEKLKSLQELVLRKCHLITSIPGLQQLVTLRELSVYGCPKVTGLFDLSKYTNLQCLDLGLSQKYRSKALEGPVSGVAYLGNLQSLVVCQEGIQDYGDLKNLTKLRKVEISRCNLEGLRCVCTLPYLERLKIVECRAVDDLGFLQNLTRLQELELRDSDFKDVSGLSKLTALRDLWLNGCNELESLPDMQGLVWLESILINSCRKLRVWSSLRMVGSNLHIDGMLPQLGRLYCLAVPLSEFPDLRQFPRLRDLYLDCEELTSLTCSGGLTILESVDLRGSWRLETLPDFSPSKRLKYLELEACVAKLNSHVIENLEAPCPLLKVKIYERTKREETQVTKREEDAKWIDMGLNSVPGFRSLRLLTQTSLWRLSDFFSFFS